MRIKRTLDASRKRTIQIMDPPPKKDRIVRVLDLYNNNSQPDPSTQVRGSSLCSKGILDSHRDSLVMGLARDSLCRFVSFSTLCALPGGRMIETIAGR